jgi:hypothetical protein
MKGREGSPARSVRPPLNGGWILACVFVAFFGMDFVKRHIHRPLCIDASGNEGETSVAVPHGSSGRASLLDNSIHCACSSGRHVRLYMPWPEYFDWYAGQFVATAALAATVALTKRQWRRRAPS